VRLAKNGVARRETPKRMDPILRGFSGVLLATHRSVENVKWISFVQNSGRYHRSINFLSYGEGLTVRILIAVQCSFLHSLLAALQSRELSVSPILGGGKAGSSVSELY